MDSDRVPVFRLGIKSGTLLLLTAISLSSLLLTIYLGDEFYKLHGPVNSSNYTTGGIYVAMNLAGLISVLSLLLSFVFVITSFLLIIAIILYLRTGMILLYDDHVEWHRKGSVTVLDYSDLKDVYIGYGIVNVSGNAYMRKQFYPYRRLSFYIDNRRFEFKTNRYKGIEVFLRAKIPRKNIDVDDTG